MAQLAMQGDCPCAFNRATVVATEGGRPALLPPSLRDRLAAAMLRADATD